jgi:predicted nucleotide-binding protein (sugar kinase/HSP70/actin superfamily)
MLAQAEFAGVDYFGVSGQLGHLTEVAAIRRALAASAWTAAVSAQEQAERALQELGRKTLDEAVAGGGIAILLAGRSYSAFAPEASQSVARKLSSMGVTVIPATAWRPSKPALPPGTSPIRS